MGIFRFSTFIVLLFAIPTHATVDLLSVNKITKEYHWGDEDHPTGWIGWTIVPEGQLGTAEAEFKETGYTRTRFPYKIESFITLVIGALMIGHIIMKRQARPPVHT